MILQFCLMISIDHKIFKSYTSEWDDYGYIGCQLHDLDESYCSFNFFLKKQQTLICWHLCNLWSENVQTQLKLLPILGACNCQIWAFKCNPIASYHRFYILTFSCLNRFQVTHTYNPLKSLILREYILFHCVECFESFFSNNWMQKSNANITQQIEIMVPQSFFQRLKGYTDCDCTLFSTFTTPHCWSPPHRFHLSQVNFHLF